jgi:signal transduction histidine kinase
MAGAGTVGRLVNNVASDPGLIQARAVMTRTGTMRIRLIGMAAWLQRGTVAFALAVVVAMLMLANSELAHYRASDELDQMALRAQARLALSTVLRRVTDAESGQRGYLLTRSADDLTPYRDAARDVELGLQQLLGLYRQLGDDDSAARLALMSADLRARLSELDEVIAMLEGGRGRSAQELLSSGIGREHMASIRQHADALLEQQSQRMDRGMASVLRTLQLNRVGAALMVVVSLTLLGLFLRQRLLLDRQRAEQQQRVRSERDRLEAEVRLRTAELTELARHLETAREDERARLARDLHDELGALLTGAKLELARIRPKLQQNLPELLPRLASLGEMLNGGIALKRRIIEDLRPSTLDTLGLVQALGVLCREFSERLGVPVTADLEPVSLQPKVELTVFRLVQESLTNIGKYAKASEVRVLLQAAAGGTRVTVQDNGVGFDPSQAGVGRHGLVGMRYRVEAEGGRLELRSSPGQGTVLIAYLPPGAASDAALAV